MKLFKQSKVLKKVRNSFILQNKLKIFLTAFLIFISSVLVLFSLLIPDSFYTYSSGILSQLNPYKSYVIYDTNPWNSPTFNYGGEDGSDNPISSITGTEKQYSTYGWYNPNDQKSFTNRQPIDKASPLTSAGYFAYLSGIAVNKTYTDNLNNFFQKLKPLIASICKLMGDSNQADWDKGVGKCFQTVVEKNAPYFVKQKFNNSDFSLTFGLTSFDPSKDEHITDLPVFVNQENENIDLWGINPNTSRLSSSITSPLKRKWLNDINKIKNQVVNFYAGGQPTPVVINRTAAKFLALKVGDVKNFSYKYQQLFLNNGDIVDPSKFKVSLLNSISNICTPPEKPGDPWKCDKNYNDYQSTYLYGDKSVVKMVYDHEMAMKSALAFNKNLKVVGVSNDVGFPRFYTTSQFAASMLFGSKNNLTLLLNNDRDYFNSFFGYFKSSSKQLVYKPNSSYYNGKLTADKSPFDLDNYNVNQQYNDYSQFGLNGGNVQFNDGIKQFAQNGKSVISNLFSWDIIHSSFWEVITSVLYIIILIVSISIFLGIIILAITTNSIMIESRKQIVLLKAFGYNDKEILRTTSGYYIFIVIVSFVLSSVLTIFFSQYLFYIFFASKNIYIPYSFHFWILFVGFFIILILYYINKLIAWHVNKKFVPAEAIKK